MNQLIYEIPDKYFKGYRVTVPFRAMVKYEVVNGKVVLRDIQMSALCLTVISNTAGLVDQIQRDIIEADKARVKERNSDLPPVMRTLVNNFSSAIK
jgi:hypothetical protein